MQPVSLIETSEGYTVTGKSLHYTSYSCDVMNARNGSKSFYYYPYADVVEWPGKVVKSCQ